jgi:YNFM family putative membrane transporter
MALIAVGMFLAQAIATGHVGRTAKREEAAASGIYLASYYAGGLVGSFELGQVFDRADWPACVAVLIVAFVAATGLARACGAEALVRRRVAACFHAASIRRPTAMGSSASI